MMKNKLKVTIIKRIAKSGVFLLFLFLFLNFAAKYTSPQKSDVLGIESSLTVQAEIGLNPVIWIKPQNRIPATNNDSLYIDIEVRPVGSTTVEHAENVTVNNQGYESMQSLSLSQVSPGQHDVAVKGLSHLRRTFSNQSFGPSNEFLLDLRYLTLLAGDTHPTSDNYINSLDISYEILHLYSGDIRADLNRDGRVNSLEFPTLISNINKYGDL
jgi:hypothetical protein